MLIRMNYLITDVSFSLIPWGYSEEIPSFLINSCSVSQMISTCKEEMKKSDLSEDDVVSQVNNIDALMLNPLEKVR